MAHILEDPAALIRAGHGAPSLAELIRWHIDSFEKISKWQRSKQTHLEFLERHSIGKSNALALTPAILIDHIRSRRTRGAGAATVANDLTWIGVLAQPDLINPCVTGGWPPALVSLSVIRVFQVKETHLKREYRRPRVQDHVCRQFAQKVRRVWNPKQATHRRSFWGAIPINSDEPEHTSSAPPSDRRRAKTGLRQFNRN